MSLFLQAFSARTPANHRTQSGLAQTVAVGKAVACLPPHRSVRAALPHTAPALGLDAKADYWIRMRRQMPGIGYEHPGQCLQTLPGQPVSLASPSQGMHPGPDDLAAEGFHLPRAPRYMEVVAMPSIEPAQPAPERLDRLVSAPVQRLADIPECGDHAFPDGLAPPPRTDRSCHASSSA